MVFKMESRTTRCLGLRTRRAAQDLISCFVIVPGRTKEVSKFTPMKSETFDRLLLPVVEITTKNDIILEAAFLHHFHCKKFNSEWKWLAMRRRNSVNHDGSRRVLLDQSVLVSSLKPSSFSAPDAITAVLSLTVQCGSSLRAVFF